MNTFQKLAAAGLFAAAALAVTTPAGAITTFSQYFEISGQNANIRWVKNGADGELFTISSPGSLVAGSTTVDFTFLQGPLTPSPIAATFTFDAKEIGQPTLDDGFGDLTQPGLTGGFSLISLGAFTFDGHPYAAGTDLLTATFDKARITGVTGSSAGGVSASTGSGSMITYISDVLAFGKDKDFALTLTQVTKAFGYVKTKALNDFTAASTGSFSASAVPEPATWGLMITGFGMMGVMARRRRAAAT